MSRFPEVRLRRLRQHPSMRAMTGLSMPGPEKFVWPVFVIDGQSQEVPITAMPGQCRYSVDKLIPAVETVMKQGINSILLFGVPEEGKSENGSACYASDGLVQLAIRELRREFPDLLIMTDVCVCAYTTHGHCGTLTKDGSVVDNDQTLETLAMMAVSHARAGADIVAPSAMMDGQVQAIRQALDQAAHTETLLMSYSTKFASAMYGPFREAAHSAPGKGDRKGYQAPYSDPRQALRESLLDVEEGADILMVKPSLLYLDLIQTIHQQCPLPIAAYNVSGEYSMLVASAERGWGDLDAMVREATMALVRSGTDILISYWANQYDRIFKAYR